jgi:hypothetical protein
MISTCLMGVVLLIQSSLFVEKDKRHLLNVHMKKPYD